jgi:methylmalonyl-CoA mutase N-terminal domain/subunit
LNSFTTEEQPTFELLEIDQSAAEKQIERLKRLKGTRDGGEVNRTLDAVRQAARNDENIMPIMIDAVKAYATVGEITDALRDVYTEYKERSAI